MEEDDSLSCYFPEAFPISLTHGEFPSSFEKLERSGLPFGMMISPFVARNDQGLTDDGVPVTVGTKVARCGQCSAYLNPFCDTNPMRWFCSVCSYRNSFNRTQSRYHGKNINSHNFEECTEIMSDFPMPFREVDKAPPSCRGKFAMGASRRPLVHVFLIQESMQLDCLKAVVECLTKVVEDMHPEVKVVFLSYSSRLGVHRLGESQFRAPGSSAEVQYVQLAGDDGKGPPIYGNPSAMRNNGGAVAAVCPVGVVADFLSTAKAIGDCTEDLQKALSDMCGSHNAYVASQNAAYGGTMPSETSQGGSTSITPQNMLCPILDEVCQWICEDTDSTQVIGSSSTMGTTGGLYTGDSDDDDFYGDEEEEEERGYAEQAGGVFGVLQDIGLGLIGAAQQPQSPNPATSTLNAGANGKGVSSGGDVAAMDRGGALGPVDRCSGVILHVFTSAPQDLPQGAHPSARSDSGSSSYFWSDDLASAVSTRGLSINLWGVSSFESNTCDLGGLAPLARRTGGSINRVVLGSYPEDEKARFNELLRRSLSSRQLATKGVLRIRASPCVNILEESVSGHMQADEKYTGVYHLAQCSSDSAMGCQIEYKNVDPAANLNPEDRGNKVAFQMAFCYDTLVEAPATTALASEEDSGREEQSIDPMLTAVVEMLEVDRSPSSPDKGGRTYAHEVDKALATLADNKREMLREIKRNQFVRNKPFFVAHSEEVLDGTDVRAISAEEKDSDQDRESLGARHELKKVIKGKSSSYWGSSAAEQPELKPEACCYDRRRRLIAVRKLRVFTVMVKCSTRQAKIVSSLRPSTLSLLIIRQAISDEMRFREAIYSAELDGQPASSVPGGDIVSPGMHFVDGWAASVVASCAAITTDANDRTQSACEEALNVNFIVRSLQLLYGARKSFIDARSAARALVYQVSQHGASQRTLEQINDAVSRVVTDDFVGWAYQMCTSDARTTQKLLYPTFYALSPCEEPSSRGARGEQVQWVVQKESPLPLKWESLYFKGSHAFLLDTGNSVILYKDSDPPPSAQPAAAVVVPPPQLAPPAASAPQSASPYKMPPPPPVTGANEPPKSAGGFGFKALDVLGSIDRGVGHLLGDSRLDESVVSEEPAESANNESKDGEAFTLDGLADSLVKEYHWLPYEVFRNITFSPLVPSIMVTEKGTNAIAPFSAALIEDTPDIQGDPYACDSYGRFIAKAVKTAQEEVKDLMKK